MTFVRWIRRYRERRALVEIARVLVAVDHATSDRRGTRRRVASLSLGAR